MDQNIEKSLMIIHQTQRVILAKLIALENELKLSAGPFDFEEVDRLINALASQYDLRSNKKC